MIEPMIEIPNKSSFKINEVCALTGVKSYVLRFWESEFSEIAPLMSSSGIKLYEHKDIEAILLIKKLLFENKFSIEKAKAELKRLMPREQLVHHSFHEIEEAFESSFGVDNDEDRCSHFSDQVNTQESIDRLIVAKSKLKQILSVTESLHQKYKW